MNKICTECGIEKHLHDFSMKYGYGHKIKTIDNTRDICQSCTRKALAEKRADKSAERKQWLNRAWI